MSWIVVAYHTSDEVYTNHSKKFIESVEKLKLPYDVVRIESSNDWYRGMQYKPTFLKGMLEKYYPRSLVYVDIDAVFLRYPHFFDLLDKRDDVRIAAHVLNHSRYGRRDRRPELLSGTLFLKNSERTKQIVDAWIEECRKDSKLWDQKALENVLGEKDLCILPEEYCVIFDYMASVKNPVIKHFQASRKMKKQGTPSKKTRTRMSGKAFPMRIPRRALF
ncbi:MAG: putative nucleotide-diphospho-sugar transferase [Candidatus Thorarchaeota archaeon]